jgi:hypothetical protein
MLQQGTRLRMRINFKCQIQIRILCLLLNEDKDQIFFLCICVSQVLTLIQTFLGPNFVTNFRLVPIITCIFNKELTAFIFPRKRDFI